VEATATGTTPGHGGGVGREVGGAGTTTILTTNGTKYTLQETAEDTKKDAAPAKPGAAGPHHSASGTIRNVTCAYPSKLTLTLEEKTGTHLTLSTKNFFQLEVSAVNFTPSGDMNPCTDLENTYAKVEYAEGADNASDGVILSIALSR
jgi:hypothetical protein